MLAKSLVILLQLKPTSGVSLVLTSGIDKLALLALHLDGFAGTVGHSSSKFWIATSYHVVLH